VALSFRQRIFAWLVVAIVVPASIAAGVALLTPQIAPAVGGVRAWDAAAASWREVRRTLAPVRLDSAARAAVARHDQEIGVSARRARQAQVIRTAFSGVLAGFIVAFAVFVGGGAIRLAGHLSRQLSRPIDELVSWTAHLRRGEPLPAETSARGAPEFAVLRDSFRTMAGELERARARDVEAAQLHAFREMARQVAHELKNPLTPMRFAIQRLAQDPDPARQEWIEVLDAESTRLEQMARDFGDLGRLPQGPASAVDVGELLQELARGHPADVEVTAEAAPGTPTVHGHYESLRRALSNLVLNAFDAVRAQGRGRVTLAARRAPDRPDTVEITVRDDGAGIAADALPHVFEPYFTTKRGGTGLGLAIVRQTVHHHGGTIAVESAAGAGTTFTILLPVGTA
jgi:signal transduction histidine kinase